MASSQPELIEEVSQQLAKYETLCGDIMSKLHEHPEELQLYYNKLTTSPLCAQPGQQGDVEQYIEHLVSQSEVVPSTYEGWVKQFALAHALVTILYIARVSKLSNQAQGQVSVRCTEIRSKLRGQVQGIQETSACAMSPLVDGGLIPPAKSDKWRAVTEQDRRAFKMKPIDLLGRWFQLTPPDPEDYEDSDFEDSEDWSQLYQIVGVGFTLQGTEFKVHFKGCLKCDNFGAEKMQEFFKDSMVFVA